MRAQAGANSEMATIVKRLEILAAYYAAASRGRSESATAALSDAVFQGSFLGTLALADAALRARNYSRAEGLAMQVIEADPYSPLLANAYVILGLCEAYQGRAQAAARRFQSALAVSPLPTPYGETQDLLVAISRFARATSAPAGEISYEMSAARLKVTQGLKDPRSLIFTDGKFILIDREQILSLSADGNILETKSGRKLEDVAAAGPAVTYYLADDAIDLGTGSLTPVSLTVGGKAKALKKLRSLAVDDRGDVYLLDQDAGLLRGSPTAKGTLDLTSVSPARGQLIRIDRRGNLYLLAAGQRSIIVLSRDGKQLTSVSPAWTTGKEPTIQYFALDSLNHLYILDSSSIQILAVNDGNAGLAQTKVGVMPLDQRPQFKNLKVIGVTSTGDVAVTGKNEDTWVLYR
jgi:tetratricopeptide (TPR) repeat protein